MDEARRLHPFIRRRQVFAKTGRLPYVLRQEAGKALARFLCRRKQPLAFSVESKGAGRLSACALLLARQSRKAVKPPLEAFPAASLLGAGRVFMAGRRRLCQGAPWALSNTRLLNTANAHAAETCMGVA